MDYSRKPLGLVAGIVSILCVISGIKVGKNIYLGQMALSPLHISYNKLVVAGIFILAFWITTKFKKESAPLWMRRQQAILSITMLIAVISYFIFY